MLSITFVVADEETIDHNKECLSTSRSVCPFVIRYGCFGRGGFVFPISVHRLLFFVDPKKIRGVDRKRFAAGGAYILELLGAKGNGSHVRERYPSWFVYRMVQLGANHAYRQLQKGYHARQMAILLPQWPARIAGVLHRWRGRRLLVQMVPQRPDERASLFPERIVGRLLD